VIYPFEVDYGVVGVGVSGGISASMSLKVQTFPFYLQY
jgi:hypothetical protein